ncbi:MAG TPA: transcriptional regulator [Flavobacterium sp.]|uniref:transcriptional regulator n=1 Tax=unclassified Flavobacterium TaxID=196869 RepID=UPI000E98509F|nr:MULTISPECIES: transcriptional regulator [unclassified Flavobacterium]HBI01568.1 transcriptional regulator [Flavobacterium sp.]HRE76838.1 transcriptional regulator [Flavobacterium sp.]
MNYIKHLTGFFDKVVQENSLNPTHISLYIALFQCWNCNRFRNPISINRDEIMQISKISSKATYHKCLKNLHSLGYINYQPSFNPFRGSHVILFNFEQEQTQGNPITTKPFSEQDNEIAHREPLTMEHTNIETSNEQVLVPSVNNTNNTNVKNSENKIEKIKKTTSDFHKKEESKEKIPSKKKEFTEPKLEETIAFFMEQKYPNAEAHKFYNYFESIGWLVGGKTPMVNWKAAANSWILNTQNTSSVTNAIANPVPGNLKTSNENKYDEPL